MIQEKFKLFIYRHKNMKNMTLCKCLHRYTKSVLKSKYKDMRSFMITSNMED